MSDSVREDLDALVTSPGWIRFTTWASAEYGPLILARAVDDPDDQVALSKLRQARAIKGAVDVMLSWPTRTLANLQAAAARQAPSDARGGGQ